jgi:pimeloyl-ACP methyl ester carboxylesterase
MLLLLPGRQVVAAGDWQVERMVTDPFFGGKMLVREAGQQNDQMILLVHGLGDEAGTTWNSVVGELAREYHVVAPDLPGFGGSSKANLLYSPDAYAQALRYLVVSLPSKPLTLVGHSLGGGVSMVYAALYGQDLQRLVLVDSVGGLHRLAVSQYFVKQQINIDLPFFGSTLENSLGRIGDLFLEKTSRIPLDPDLVLNSETMRSKFLAGEPSRIAALALVQTDYSLLLGKIRVPTWLIWGELDEVATLRIAKMLQWMLPQTQLRVLQDLGHTPMLEDPRSFLPELMGALETEPRGLSPAVPEEDATDRCLENETGGIFRGTYGTLSINNCKNIRLINVAAKHLEIIDSEVIIEGATIVAEGEESGIHLLRSKLTMTGADIHAGTGIVTDQSRMDLAGVRYIGTRTAIRGEGNPSALLSSSSVKQFTGTTTAIHISRSVTLGDEL